MDIDKFEKRFERIKKSNFSFEYEFGEKLSKKDFEFVENKIDLVFPEKIKEFYNYNNGLKTLNPNFEIIKLNELKVENSLVHFATFDNNKQICFEIENLNEAKEWNILEKETKYKLTLTISSFWANKIWKWLENEKKIWKDEFWKKE